MPNNKSFFPALLYFAMRLFIINGEVFSEDTVAAADSAKKLTIIAEGTGRSIYVPIMSSVSVSSCQRGDGFWSFSGYVDGSGLTFFIGDSPEIYAPPSDKDSFSESDVDVSGLGLVNMKMYEVKNGDYFVASCIKRGRGEVLGEKDGTISYEPTVYFIISSKNKDFIMRQINSLLFSRLSPRSGN